MAQIDEVFLTERQQYWLKHIRASDMAHARRKFSEAVKSQGKNKKAGKAQHAL